MAYNNIHRDPVGPQQYRYHDTDLYPLLARREYERAENRRVRRYQVPMSWWAVIGWTGYGVAIVGVMGACAWMVGRMIYDLARR